MDYHRVPFMFQPEFIPERVALDRIAAYQVCVLLFVYRRAWTNNSAVR